MSDRLSESQLLLTLDIAIAELDTTGWTRLNAHQSFKLDAGGDNCERIDVNKVSPEEFIEKYEKLYKPVVITGVCQNWKAQYKWTLEVSETVKNWYFKLLIPITTETSQEVSQSKV